MTLSVESKKFDNIVNEYNTITKDSKNDAEGQMTSACRKYSRVPAKITQQVTKITNALQTYRTGTIKKRIKMLNDKKEDFERAGDKIKQIFESFEAKVQSGIKFSTETANITGVAVGKDKFKDFVINEKDLPKVWKATAVDTVLNDLSQAQYSALTEAAKKFIGTYDKDAVKSAKISSYMVSIALPCFEATIYKMVKVYLNAPEKFEIDFNMPLYNTDEFGQAELNTVGILADLASFEYGDSPISISKALNDAYNELETSLLESAEAWNAYLNTKSIGTIQKIKLEETKKYSSEELQAYSTEELSDIFKQVDLENLTARIDLMPTSELVLSGNNDNGYFDVVLEEPRSFAVVASDENGFEIFGFGNFYYVKFEDMELNKTPFNLYYTA